MSQTPYRYEGRFQNLCCRRINSVEPTLAGCMAATPSQMFGERLVSKPSRKIGGLLLSWGPAWNDACLDAEQNTRERCGHQIDGRCANRSRFRRRLSGKMRLRVPKRWRRPSRAAAKCGFFPAIYFFVAL